MNRVSFAPCTPMPVTITLHRPWCRRLVEAMPSRRNRCPHPAHCL